MEPARPIISVIVAAYNADQYLRRCLDSILAQTFTDFEVILIDDGSTDDTGRIADEYASKDARFQVMHQENKGIAATRQIGLDAAAGEYTIHADADDWMDPDILKTLYTCAVEEHADMTFCDFLVIHSKDIIEYRSQKPKSLDHTQLMGQMLFDLHGVLWNKLVRTSVIREKGIRFLEGMNFAEDQYFILRLLSHDIKVAYVPKALYNYDHTQNNASFCNRGITAVDRMFPLELIAEYTDITPIQDYYDKAVFHAAFEYLYEPDELCPDYQAVFNKHIASYRRVKGYPFRAKLFVLLRVHGIRLPLREIKRLWKRITRSE